MTLESSVALSLTILLLLGGIAMAPPLYLMARQAARLEVLSVYEDLSGDALYKADRLQFEEVSITGLQTSPQRVLEIKNLIRYAAYIE